MFANAKEARDPSPGGVVQKKNKGKTEASPNLTGIPDSMKSRLESQSGFSFDDVRVHYNSDKPAQLQALAYTQGNRVYIAPGQGRHLPHEMGHVIQQKQGRVQANFRLGGAIINNDPALEAEAGALADGARIQQSGTSPSGGEVIQRITVGENEYGNFEDYRAAISAIAPGTRTLQQKTALALFNTIIRVFGTGFLDSLNCNTVVAALDDATLAVIKQRIFDDWVDKKYKYLAALYKKSEQAFYRYGKPDFLSYFSGNDEYIVRDFFNAIGDVPEVVAAMVYHKGIDRSLDDSTVAANNIDPADISEPFVNAKSCVITALMYACNDNVLGTTTVEGLHKLLVTGFSDSFTDAEEPKVNRKHFAWKNYSDDKVYPTLYSYLGFTSVIPETVKNLSHYEHDATCNGKNGMLELKPISGGIGHVVGFRNGFANLHDNEVGGVYANHGNKRVTRYWMK